MGSKMLVYGFDLENLKPTYQLLIGIPGRSNAFAISRKLGLSENIITRASSMIDKDTFNFEDLLKSIYDDKSKLENEKIKITNSLKEIEELKKNLKSQNSDVLAKEKELISNAKQEAKQILIDAKETANDIIKNINSSSASQANKLRNNLNEKITSLKTTPDELEISHSIAKEKIEPNLEVFVSNLNSNGIVVSNVSKDNTVQVQIGAIKMNIDIKFLQETKKSSNISKDYTYSKRPSLKSQSVSPEITYC